MRDSNTFRWICRTNMLRPCATLWYSLWQRSSLPECKYTNALSFFVGTYPMSLEFDGHSVRYFGIQLYNCDRHSHVPPECGGSSKLSR